MRFCKPVRLMALAALLAGGVRPAVAAEEAERDSAALRYGRAVGEAVFVNIAVNGFDRACRLDYAGVTPWTVRHNLTHSWWWDQDGYPVNNMGHPYQGSLYFVAGRANGLPLWQSLLLATFGSATWEIAGEKSRPSINDIFYTPLGGMAYGEILHRLWREVHAAGSPLAVLVSPMDGVNRLLTRRHPLPEDAGSRSNVTELSVGAALGCAAAVTRADGGTYTEWYPAVVRPQLLLVYGEPYGLATLTPYKHFDVDVRTGAGGGSRFLYDVRLLTSGTLMACAPDTGMATDTTLELAFDYDILFTPYLYYSAFMLGPQLRQRHEGRFSVLSYTLSLGAVPLCASDYFYLMNGDPAFSVETEYHRRYNYGTGGELKGQLRVEVPGVRSLDMGARLVGRYIIPAAEASNASDGVELLALTSVEVRQHLSGVFFIGAGVEWYGKIGRYASAPNVFQMAASGSVIFSTRFR